jgi:RNA polymerase sigma factor (sigma-70 family)
MQEAADWELLRQYVHRDSNEAFAALLARHVNMVYSVALRKTGNPQAAEEITQVVFIILAKKARGLSKKIVLSGWLYHTARLTAVNFLRADMRRVRREQEAYMQSLDNETEPEIWRHIAPLLEDGMARLGEKDRDALVLRFFEGKSFQDIASAVGATENAAKKRVHYALEKLRRHFAKRGVVSTASALAGAMATCSVQAAPMALVQSLSAATLAKGTAASAPILALVKATLKTLLWAKVKSATGLGAGLLAAGAGVALAVVNMQGIAAGPTVDAFKQYLATPTCVERIRYREFQGNTSVMYVGAECNGNFFLRIITGAEKWDMPISQTNRNKSPLYVGRMGDARWQIAGFAQTTSYTPNTRSPDPFATMSDTSRIVLNGILALGPQHVRYGTAVWQGDTFKIRASEFMKQMSPNAPEFLPGRIFVTNGVVAAMEVKMCGEFHYVYDSNGTLPPGIPSEIWALADDGRWVRKIRIDELRLQPTVPDDWFDPEAKIDHTVMMRSIWSNSVEVVKATPNETVVQLVRKEVVNLHGGQAQMKKRVVWVRAALVGVTVILFGTIALRRKW